MVIPDDWKEFVESGELDKIQSDTWKFVSVMRSGIPVIIPVKIPEETNPKTFK